MYFYNNKKILVLEMNLFPGDLLNRTVNSKPKFRPYIHTCNPKANFVRVKFFIVFDRHFSFIIIGNFLNFVKIVKKYLASKDRVGGNLGVL